MGGTGLARPLSTTTPSITPRPANRKAAGLFAASVRLKGGPRPVAARSSRTVYTHTAHVPIKQSHSTCQMNTSVNMSLLISARQSAIQIK